MLLDDAWRCLGIAPTSDRRALRVAYLHRLREVHPDRSNSPAANDATVALLEAYEAVLEALEQPPLPSPTHAPESKEESAGVSMAGNDTIAVALPPTDAYLAALDAAHRLGEVIGVEPPSGLVQVLMELQDAAGSRIMCQLLITLQGRATGVTELCCAIEPLDSSPSPPIGAVTELLFDELVAGGAARA